MIRENVRTARKAHHCDDCRRLIRPGERYRDLAASPGHDDLGNVGWWRVKDCSDCARRRGKPISACGVEVGQP